MRHDELTDALSEWDEAAANNGDQMEDVKEYAHSAYEDIDKLHQALLTIVSLLDDCSDEELLTRLKDSADKMSEARAMCGQVIDIMEMVDTDAIDEVRGMVQ